MWLSLFILLILPNMSYGAPTSSGSTYPEEAQVLWREGANALEKSHFQDGVNYLQRLVDRYPGDSHALDAKLLLAKSLLELGRVEEAVPLLKSFISMKNTRVESIRARILLGEAYIRLRKYLEAELASEEIQRTFSHLKSSDERLQEARLIKIQALIGLKREFRAKKLLDYTQKQITPQTSKTIQSRAHLYGLKLKTLECSHLPSHASMDEQQLRNQLDRRGTCLNESLLLFRKLLTLGDLPMTQEAGTILSDAFKAYSQSCTTPPVPQDAVFSKRDSRQKSIYRAELTDLLAEDCKKNQTTAQDLIASWQKDLDPATSRIVENVSKTLKNLRIE